MHGDIIVGSNVAPPDTTIYPGLDGSPPDTVITHPAIGPVIISKNEDVDFRAHGRVILKSGFHARAGCFFHAYTYPKWDTTVFADEFNDAVKFHNQWFIYNGHTAKSGTSTPQAQYDTDVALVTDPDAHDGHALDVRFRVNVDTFSCDSIIEYGECSDSVWHDSHGFPEIHKSFTSSGYIRSCPFSLNLQ